MSQPASADADRHWLARAIALSRSCPPSATAYSVGAVLVGGDGTVLSTGYSRETAPADHAEEVALAKLGRCGPPLADARGRQALADARGRQALADASGRPALADATLYSSLEPCAVRASRPVPCCDLIVAAGIGRVVVAWLEPPLLAPGGGASRLRSAGVAVTELTELAAQARAVNEHLLRDQPRG